MNYDEKKQIITNKINANNRELTEEELYILRNDDDLNKYLIQKAKEDHSWYDFISTYDLIDSDEVAFELGEDFFVSYIKTCIKRNNLSCMGELGPYISEENFDYLMNECIKRIESQVGLPVGINLCDDVVDAILDAKRYDLLQYDIFDEYSHMSDDVAYRLMVEYPFDKFFSTKVEKIICSMLDFVSSDEMVAKILVPDVLSRLPLDILLKISSCNIISDQGKQALDLKKIIIDKVKNGDYIKLPSSSNYNYFHFEFTEDEKKDLFVELWNRENLSMAIYIDPYHELTKEEAQQIMNQLKQGFEFAYLPSNFLNLVDKEELSHIAVINANFNLIKFILSVTRSCDDLIFSLVAKEINNNNVKYFDIFTMPEALLNSEEVLTALFTIDFNDEISRKRFAYLMDNVLQSSIVDNDKIIKMIYNDLMNGRCEDIKIDYMISTALATYDPHMLEKLLENGYICTFLKLVKNLLMTEDLNLVLNDQQQDIIIKSIAENYLLGDYLINSKEFLFQHLKLFEYMMLNGKIFAKNIIDYIQHNDDVEFIYNEDAYQIIRKYYVMNYQLNNSHIDILKDKFGLRIIRYLDNDNIRKIIQLNDDMFNRLVALFEQKEFTMNNLDTVYDAIKQYEFSKNKVGIISIFASIKHSFDDNNDNYVEYMKEIAPFLDQKFYDRFHKQYPNFDATINSSDLLDYIADKIKNGNEEEKSYYYEMLHFITQYYIAIQRENYRRTYNKLDDLSLSYNLDEKDALNQLLRSLIEDNTQISTDYCFNDLILKRLVEQGYNASLIQECILYYIYGNKYQYENDLKLIKKNIKYIVSEGKKIINDDLNTNQIHSKLMVLNLQNLIKRNYFVEQPKIDTFKLLMNLRLDILEKEFLGDTPEQMKIYDSLLKTLSKYSLLYLPNCLQEFMQKENINLNSNVDNLVAFISYYAEIYKSEEKKLVGLKKNTDNIMLTIPNIFLSAEAYSSVSDIYASILGIDDSRLIKTNPGPNSASMKIRNNERLNEAVQWTISNFRRMEVTVPTFNEVMALSEGKKIQTVVGNFTNPCNLTHGERTGACMRIGGVGETLFNFCLENKNGFHIRFQNPETGEYISRVSGFRNGNTVFLNELRNSCNTKEYSDQDIVESCQLVAQKIIEYSKNSTCPICNVVLHNAYATLSVELPQQDLGVKNCKIGLPQFYTDVNRHAIVLATSAQNNDIVPINFDKQNVPSYLPARDKFCEFYSSRTIASYVSRIDSIKKILTGQNYKYVKTKTVDDKMVYGFANNDWYIYVTAAGEIYEEVIDIDPRALEELKVARKLVEQYNIGEEEVLKHAI